MYAITTYIFMYFYIAEFVFQLINDLSIFPREKF